MHCGTNLKADLLRKLQIQYIEISLKGTFKKLKQETKRRHENCCREAGRRRIRWIFFQNSPCLSSKFTARCLLPATPFSMRFGEKKRKSEIEVPESAEESVRFFVRLLISQCSLTFTHTINNSEMNTGKALRIFFFIERK